MFKFWDLVLADAFAAIDAKRVLEIGADLGHCTTRLLAYCESVHGHLDCIDPAPRFDADALAARYGPTVTFHRCPSLEALPGLQDLDVALIDGDHNWYTVFHELKLLEAGARERARDLPLIFLHDVAWPYGRRDMYYVPERIPAEFRWPYACQGLERGQSRLSPTSRFNAEHCNALEEGGPRNGVRTAVEDFLHQSERVLTFHVIPADFGLGILIPETLQQNQRLLALVRFWEGETGLRRLVDFLEQERIAALAEVVRLQECLTGLGSHQADLGAATTAGREEAEAALRRAVGSLERELAAMRRSRSWRLTRPLRAVTEAVRRLRARL